MTSCLSLSLVAGLLTTNLTTDLGARKAALSLSGLASAFTSRLYMMAQSRFRLCHAIPMESQRVTWGEDDERSTGARSGRLVDGVLHGAWGGRSLQTVPRLPRGRGDRHGWQLLRTLRMDDGGERIVGLCKMQGLHWGAGAFLGGLCASSLTSCIWGASLLSRMNVGRGRDG